MIINRPATGPNLGMISGLTLQDNTLREPPTTLDRTADSINKPVKNDVEASLEPFTNYVLNCCQCRALHPLWTCTKGFIISILPLTLPKLALLYCGS